jgi:methyltransferase (TIGR00027 family)
MPNASKSMHVAHVRYFQSRYEAAGYVNPDTFVGQLIPARQRWWTAWHAKRERKRLRAEPFYYYLLARTRHYDDVVTEAVEGGIDRMAVVGCGSDTRAYRFRQLLAERRIKVLECDQAESIAAKERLVRQVWQHEHVEFSAIDLNERAWQGLERWLAAGTSRALLFMEGVSPYIQATGFREFLTFTGRTLPAGSQVAYDFKIEGVRDELGKTERVSEPFRLPNRRDDVARFHAEYRLKLIRMETSLELCERMLPQLTTSPRFSEDVLVRLEVA